MANWRRVCRQKRLGGLGIKDLTKFGRVRIVHDGFGHGWKEPNRSWVGMEVLCDDTDRLLFDASTEIAIGDGPRRGFGRPKEISPNCSKLVREET